MTQHSTLISIKDLKKTFLLSHSGVASFKTMLLWWRRRELEQLEVLRGINLEIKSGECVALVGRNGAGKSTLLSLIANVYKPSGGEISIHGRIAPLLELGAGFHPDLTGYENILFNGMILGLSRKEARERTESIIEFSELRRHIDAPVRSFSSGMMARLGFSVAVHVDADVLIVDEVLAVGDYAFEQKCYKRIEEFRDAGGAVLFVSHQVEPIERVATRCLWLHEGLIRLEGSPSEVISAYRQVSVAPSDA